MDTFRLSSSDCEHASDTRKRTWRLSVEKNGVKMQPPGPLQDPFPEESYKDYFKMYVEGPPKWSEFDDRPAQVQTVLDELHKYRNGLLGFLNSLGDEGGIERRIEILEDQQVGQLDSRSSLHTIVWEVLEHRISRVEPELRESIPGPLDANVEGISVVRIIKNGQPMQTNGELEPTTTSLWPKTAKKPIKILLVVSRSIRRGAKDSRDDYEDRVPPDNMSRVLFQIARYLQTRQHHRQIEIYVVRPGTFKELTDQLEAFRQAKTRFDIIHLDMHGDQGTKLKPSSLCFTPPPSNSTITMPDKDGYHTASCVADRVCRYTDYLIINACNYSGSYGGGPGVELIRPFLRGAISVSAMNFYVLDMAVKVYYRAFYLAFLMNGDFHDAAAVARVALRQDVDRGNSGGIMDYFIPALWTTREDYKATGLKTPNVDTPPEDGINTRASMSRQNLLNMFNYPTDEHNRTAQEPSHRSIAQRYEDLTEHIEIVKKYEKEGPKFTTQIYELEYWLSAKTTKHCVYLHGMEVKDPGFERALKRVAQAWVDTNFVKSVKYVDAQFLSRSWIEYFAKLYDEPWSLGRSTTGFEINREKPLSVEATKPKRMLIIGGAGFLDTWSTRDRQDASLRIHTAMRGYMNDFVMVIGEHSVLNWDVPKSVTKWNQKHTLALHSFVDHFGYPDTETAD